LGAGGERVGPLGEAVAFTEWVGGDPLEGLAARAAGDPDDPRVGRLFRQLDEVADGRGRGVAAADDHDVLAGVVIAFSAAYVFESVGEVLLGGPFAQGRDAAVAEPAVLPVGACAIEDDVRFLDALLALAVAQEKAKRLLGALRIADPLGLEVTLAADVQHFHAGLDDAAQQTRLRQGLEVALHVLASGDAIAPGGELVPGIFGEEG